MIISIKRIFLASLIMALPMLVSCGNVQQQEISPVKNNKGQVTLECVVPFDDVQKNEVFKNFVTDMQPIFPDYNIHLSFVEGGANVYNPKLKVMMYSDTPPDIIYSGDGKFTKELYSLKTIQPIEKKLNDLDYWNMVIPSAKVSGDNGQIYAVPIDEVSYNVMLINTEMFSENNIKIPESFEELKSAVIQFKEKSINPIAIGGQDGMNVYNMIEGFACTKDDQMTSKIIRGDDTFSGEIFKQAATSVAQLIKLGAFQEKSHTISDEAAANLFYSSEAAIYCTSTDKLKLASDKLGEKVAVLYYPDQVKPEGSIPKKIVTGGIKQGSGLLISASTKYPTEATKIAVEMSKYYNKNLYEKQGSGAIIYNLANLKWTPSIVPDQKISKLMINVRQEGTVNKGLFEENISPDKEKSIKQASTAFMTGLLSVRDYLKAMDISMKLK